MPDLGRSDAYDELLATYDEEDDYSVTLTIRTIVQAATLREALDKAKALVPTGFDLRRFDVEGIETPSRGQSDA